MNEQLKHRLVGAAVLVSFVVIVLPMVLRPPSDTSQSTLAPDIPAPREGRFEVDNRPLEESQFIQSSNEFSSSSNQPRERPAGDLPVSSNHKQQILASGRNDANRELGAARELDERTQSRRNGVQIAEPGGKDASPRVPSREKPRGWAVQLGTFSKRGNAVALRDRLQTQGYYAFLRPTTPSHAALTRVYVGLQLSREEARQLSRVLGEKTRLKGLVVPYP